MGRGMSGRHRRDRVVRTGAVDVPRVRLGARRGEHQAAELGLGDALDDPHMTARAPSSVEKNSISWLGVDEPIMQGTMLLTIDIEHVHLIRRKVDATLPPSPACKECAPGFARPKLVAAVGSFVVANL